MKIKSIPWVFLFIVFIFTSFALFLFWGEQVEYKKSGDKQNTIRNNLSPLPNANDVLPNDNFYKVDVN